MYNSQLNVFICVADCGSFTKAAEKLFISSTAVMKQINSLEEHLNLKLMDRSRHGINLTAAGKSIYKDAKFIMDYSKKAIETAHELVETIDHTFCVGTSMLNPCKIFMDLWYQIDDKFPGYKLHIVPFEDNHETILSEIAALGRKFDFLVGACDSTHWLNLCNFYELDQYKFCCAVSRNHKLADRNILEIEDLYGERLLMVKQGDSSRNDLLRYEIEQNHPQIIVEDTPTFYDIEVFNYCEKSGNILLTLDIWSNVHPSLVTIPVNWEYAIPYGILYPLNPLEDILKCIRAIEKIKHNNIKEGTPLG